MPKERRAHPYGTLVRERRVAAGKSLREVAASIGVSHAYLADVEIGAHGPLDTSYEPALVKCLKNLTRAELADARAQSSLVRITLWNTPARYAELTRALARRLEREDLDDDAVARIMAILLAD
jgi:transcriptional regulator with XRE-family HTH domain